MHPSSRTVTDTAGHGAAARRVRPLAVCVVALALAAPAAARADAEPLRLTLGMAETVHRFHSLAADTLGLSYDRAYSGVLGMEFRVLQLPASKTGPLPALYVTGGLATDERTLGPYLAGQDPIRMPIIVMDSGILLKVPLELVRPNTGVALRLGWQGSYVLGRTGGSEFLTISKGRVGFERTAGWFEGSYIDVGMGRNETYARDTTAGGRWDVHVALRGRLLPPLVWQPAPARPAAAAAAPGAAGKAPARPAAAPAPAGPGLLWIFADLDVDTDGGVGPDGLALRVGLSADVAGFLQTVFGSAAR